MSNGDLELGRRIYMDALSDRRGFDPDLDIGIWAEIYENIGAVARAAVEAESRSLIEAYERALKEIVARPLCDSGDWPMQSIASAALTAAREGK